MTRIETDVWQGGIEELEVDAIVLPATESLFMTSPLAGAVKRAGGEGIERDAVAQGPVPPGGAVVTGGGLLAAPYVIHAVAVGHDLQRDPDRLRRAFAAALRIAEHLQLRRIAVAPLGTERGVFETEDAAAIMAGVITEHGRAAGFPEWVVFAQGGHDETTAVRAGLARVLTGPA